MLHNEVVEMLLVANLVFTNKNTNLAIKYK